MKEEKTYGNIFLQQFFSIYFYDDKFWLSNEEENREQRQIKLNSGFLLCLLPDQDRRPSHSCLHPFHAKMEYIPLSHKPN